MIHTKKQAEQIAGTLSKPSKMPCKGTSIPAIHCNVGSKLRDIEGSVCADCYAMKGNYQFKGVQLGLERRLAGINSPHWVEAMTVLIGKDKYFRWHDSGDIQNYYHLLQIVSVCENTPNTKHWLPTKEKAIVNRYLRENGKFPPNLVVRLSAYMVNGKPPKWAGLLTSTVHNGNVHNGRECIAYKQNGECKECRACWDKRVKNVSYPKH